MAKPTGKGIIPGGRGLRVSVFGVVQGVGFRPFIYRLALRFGYKGWVKNAGTGVEIHAERTGRTQFPAFIKAIVREGPLLAKVEKIDARPAPFRAFRNFAVKESRKRAGFVFISPDIATCPNCLKDVANANDRRFRYPFTNCTDCGPRYTIVRELPYDRSKTTMSVFKMCSDCSAEYHDPKDRRYHAEPVACPRCGPAVVLRDAKTRAEIPGGIPGAADLIRQGKILAVKGLGGFHLVCDPLNASAVRRLRKIKARETKPLALMARDVKTIKEYAHLSREEESLLLSERRPIVLLKKKKEIPGIAPNLGEIGFMLPYTPLHHLLLENLSLVVATSSNQKDAPIIKEADESLRGLGDGVLDHNRRIEMRADDSVAKIVGKSPLFIRRARGYVPYPQKVPADLVSSRHILALGGELKDTVSIYKDGYVVTSQFLGDLDEYRNRRYFEETIAHLKRLFNVHPACVVSDLHPGFHTSRYAAGLGIPHYRVQHHHAHLAATLLEHGFEGGIKILGVTWDGYGYGEDGSAWGGEFLIGDYLGFKRIARFEPVPLPGGDLAAKQPWRMALAYLAAAGIDGNPKIGTLKDVQEKSIGMVREMIRRESHSPLSSSCGRLFDAVSAFCGLAPLENEFEAEAAMRLESAALAGVGSSYSFDLKPNETPYVVSFSRTIREILSDLESGLSSRVVSAKFHNTLVGVILRVARKTKRDWGIDRIALSGGVFLNGVLLGRAVSRLEREGFRVFRPVMYSPNDESLSVGQIGYALARLKKRAAAR